MAAGVAMVINVFYPSIGGAQTHTLRVCQQLRQIGEPVLVVTRHHPGLARYEEIDGVPTYRVGRPSRFKPLAAITYVWGALWVLIRQRRRYGVLHCHQMVAPMTIGLLARLLLRRPVVINPHGRGPIGDVGVLTTRRPITGRLRIAAARRWADAFISIARDVHDELRGIGIAEERIWDIPNGVNLEHFRPLTAEQRAGLRTQLGLPAGRLVIFSGRLTHAKALDVLIESWPRVLAAVPDAQLVLVGAGTLQPALEAQATERSVRERLHFMGGQSDVAPFLQAGDCFVLSSRSEAMPIALLEAMACAQPCVATAVGGTPEVMRDGVSGRLVPVENPAALAEGLIEALTDPAAASWGQQAREHVARHYSLRAVAEQYIELYRALVTPHDERATLAGPSRAPSSSTRKT